MVVRDLPVKDRASAAAAQSPVATQRWPGSVPRTTVLRRRRAWSRSPSCSPRCSPPGWRLTTPKFQDSDHLHVAAQRAALVRDGLLRPGSAVSRHLRHPLCVLLIGFCSVAHRRPGGLAIGLAAGLLTGTGRVGPDALRRRHPGAAVPDHGDHFHLDPRAGRRQGHLRGRLRPDRAVRPHRAGRRPAGPRPGFRRGRRPDGRVPPAHRLAPHPAERDLSSRRAGDHPHQRGDPRRLGPVLSRAGCGAADAGLGPDDLRGACLHQHRAVDLGRAGSGARPPSDRAQHRRRRRARAVRPQDAHATGRKRT